MYERVDVVKRLARATGVSTLRVWCSAYGVNMMDTCSTRAQVHKELQEWLLRGEEPDYQLPLQVEEYASLRLSALAQKVRVR